MRVYLDSDIVQLCGDKIVLQQEGRQCVIPFARCAEDHAKSSGAPSGRCIAERNILDLSFTFFTNPKISIVMDNGLMARLRRGSAVKRFHQLQKHILSSGYTTYDLS